MLSITFLKEFIETNVDSDMIIKKVKHVEWHISVRTVFLNTNIKADLTECKCLCCNKNYQQKFDEKL